MSATLDAETLLGAGGLLAQRLERFEARPLQITMARAVERALDEERILLCEAGTGTGKTLAYLLPALTSGRKVLVSTATRALQDQILHVELPLAERALGRTPRAVVLKGLPNYLCRRRFDAALRSPESLKPRVSAALRVIRDWAAETETGDVAELAALREDDAILGAVTASSDTRLGQRCPFHEQCFVTARKREADRAELVVVNHHLFFADLALRGPHPGRVLPDYDAVIFDEAHQLEDVATSFFGARVTRRQIARLATDAERLLAEGGPLISRGASALCSRLEEEAARFFAAVETVAGGAERRRPIDRRQLATPQLVRDRAALDLALGNVEAASEERRGRILASGQQGSDTSAADALEILVRRIEGLREQLSRIADGAPGRVSWVEGNRDAAALTASPIELGPILRERLFEQVPAIVLTSATLAAPTGRGATASFGAVRRSLGIDELITPVDELVLPTPFDVRRRALLYVPRDLPDPRAPDFHERAAERTAELVAVTGGGAFVLTTSLRSMRMLHERLEARLPSTRILVQGAASKATLLERFKNDGNAVLVATASFWEGVDVPGRALRLVILEKTPFPVPTDPVVRARGEAIEAAGGSAFRDLHLPAASMTLKQGFGRLLRRHDDFGVVAVLDRRLAEKPYGGTILAAVGDAGRADDLGEVRAWWASIEAGQPTPSD